MIEGYNLNNPGKKERTIKITRKILSWLLLAISILILITYYMITSNDFRVFEVDETMKSFDDTTSFDDSTTETTTIEIETTTVMDETTTLETTTHLVEMKTLTTKLINFTSSTQVSTTTAVTKKPPIRVNLRRICSHWSKHKNSYLCVIPQKTTHWKLKEKCNGHQMIPLWVNSKNLFEARRLAALQHPVGRRNRIWVADPPIDLGPTWDPLQAQFRHYDPRGKRPYPQHCTSLISREHMTYFRLTYSGCNHEFYFMCEIKIEDYESVTVY